LHFLEDAQLQGAWFCGRFTEREREREREVRERLEKQVCECERERLEA
jgi:hypothetical protein